MAFDLSKIKGFFVVTEETKKDQINDTETPDPVNNQQTKETSKQEEKPRLRTRQSSVPTNLAQTELNKPTTEPLTTEPPTTEPTAEQSGAFNPKIYDSLTKAIYDANISGEDYLEYIQALDAMKNIALDENIKIQTVLATLSTRGLSVQKILESSQHYLKVLENEKIKFQQVLDSQTKGQIEKKHDSIKQLVAKNKELAEQIQIISQEMNDNSRKIDDIKTEIHSSESKIAKTAGDFFTTYETIVNKIGTDVQKVYPK